MHGLVLPLAGVHADHRADDDPDIGILHMEGRTDNTAIRLAAMVALGVSLVFLLLTILSITMTVPKGGGSRDLGKIAPSPTPQPQLPPDDAKEAVLNRLSALSIDDLEKIEKQVLVNELEQLDTKVLKQLVAERRS